MIFLGNWIDRLSAKNAFQNLTSPERPCADGSPGDELPVFMIALLTIHTVRPRVLCLPLRIIACTSRRNECVKIAQSKAGDAFE